MVWCVRWVLGVAAGVVWLPWSVSWVGGWEGRAVSCDATLRLFRQAATRAESSVEEGGRAMEWEKCMHSPRGMGREKNTCFYHL